MSLLSIGVSGMTASQQQLNITGQNLTNASNPAYHRQDGILAARENINTGSGGVDLVQIRRLVDVSIQSAINRNSTSVGDSTRQLETLKQVQEALSPTDGSLAQALSAFYVAAQQLTSTPDDLSLRRAVTDAAQNLTQQLHDNAATLDSTGADLVIEGKQVVSEINGITSQIANLNGAISAARLRGDTPNTLEDQRDDLINQLAQRVQIQTVDQGNGLKSITANGATLVVGTDAIQLTAKVDDQNKLAIFGADPTVEVPLEGGKLGALLSLRNDQLTSYRQQLDDFAGQLVQTIDSIHSTGIGLGGPFANITSTRPVSSVTAALATAGLDYPPQAGSLYVSVTDTTTGARTTTRIDVDPTTQSLSDVAASLSTIPHLSASVDSVSGKLTINAGAGYRFDFAGRPATTPDTQAITGTSTVAVNGNWTGAANDTLTYKVVGSGTVGVTPGLSLEVRNAAGAVLDTLGIGQGYSPGSTLTVNGISVTLKAGTVNDGDTFTVTALAKPDTAGLLTSLGINTFFTGAGASSLKVRSDLLADPSGFAASGTGGTGDGGVLAKLIASQDEVGGAGTTLAQTIAKLNGIVADRIHNLTAQQASQSALGDQLTAEQQTISGVDPNAELVKMLQYQRGFQMSARFVSTVNATYDDLLAILR